MYHMDVSENNGTPKSSILIGFSILNHPFWGTLILGNTYIFVVLSLFLIHLHPFFFNEEIPQVSNHTFESRYQCQRPIQVHASPAWASFPWDDFPSKFARIFSMKNCEKLWWWIFCNILWRDWWWWENVLGQFYQKCLVPFLVIPSRTCFEFQALEKNARQIGKLRVQNQWQSWIFEPDTKFLHTANFSLLFLVPYSLRTVVPKNMFPMDFLLQKPLVLKKTSKLTNWFPSQSLPQMTLMTLMTSWSVGLPNFSSNSVTVCCALAPASPECEWLWHELVKKRSWLQQIESNTSTKRFSKSLHRGSSFLVKKRLHTCLYFFKSFKCQVFELGFFCLEADFPRIVVPATSDINIIKSHFGYYVQQRTRTYDLEDLLYFTGR